MFWWLGTFWSVATCARLWRRNWPNDRWFAALFAWVGQAHVLEAVTWLDEGCASGLNKAASMALLAVYALAPLAHSLVALACTPDGRRRPRHRAQVAAAAAFAAFFAEAALGGMGSTAVTAATAGHDGGAVAPLDWCSRPCATPACHRRLRWGLPGWAANVHASWHVAFTFFLAAPLLRMQPTAQATATAAFLAAAHLWAYKFQGWCTLIVPGGLLVPLRLGRPPVYAAYSD